MLCAVAASASAQEASFSTGPATQIDAGLIDCGRGSRPSALGEIVSDDGTLWTVPAATQFDSAPKATDLFNECGGSELASIADLDVKSVPVVDAGGNEEFMAYLFADNYFELYVDGTLLAVDPVPFTPFNSNVVRFTAERPLALCNMTIDWKENLRLGFENNQGQSLPPRRR